MADKDLVSQQEARDAVDAAHLAFDQIAEFDQAKIDQICDAMANAALREAERLGALAHTETGFGRAEDKREKNRFAAEDVWNYFRDLKTVGIVSDDGDIVEIVSPRGVVAAIVPSTNPTSTAIFKIIIALKARNSIVISPHPFAKESIAETARVMRESGVSAGMPSGAVQCLTSSTLQGTEALMKHKNTAVILATGGIGLVRAAYSSGKPAFGVGPGNVPVYIERTADIEKAVADILTSTCFDNGTICASEQSVVVDSAVAKNVRERFEAQGGHFLDESEAAKVGQILMTPEGNLNPKIVGKSAAHIANLAGISIPDGKRCLLADCAGVGKDFPWSIEKLSPTLAFFVVDGIEQGAQLCQEILRFGGMGHTAGMHTQNREAAIQYGEAMPASRVVINSPTTHGAIGFSTALPPSMTLGCGSWGGNVTSDNVSPHHLMDIKRVAFETKPVNRGASNGPLSNSSVATPDKIASRPITKLDSRNVTRKEIAAIVDNFLGSKLRNVPTSPDQSGSQSSDSKTVVHNLHNDRSPNPVDFVSENDVRDAINEGRKIYLTKKAIVTPAAKDLGNDHDVFAKT